MIWPFQGSIVAVVFRQMAPFPFSILGLFILKHSLFENSVDKSKIYTT